ncbi:MAG: hypothetical protein GF400_00260 [Candidatus Eisenbacteria bacterium]|nr:hypothetical protein [Candidatus Eisenbacteria bacterium]
MTKNLNTPAVATLAAALCLAALLARPAPAGAVTICDVQDYDSAGFSLLEGETVTVKGAVIVPPGLLQPQYTSMYIQQGDCGVNIFCFDLLPFELALGDSVQVTGEVVEYVSSGSGAGATTEIMCESLEQIELLSTGNDPVEAAALDLPDVNLEDNEGRLVKTIGIVIDNNFDFSMYLGDPYSGASVQVYKSYIEGTDFSVFVPGDTLEITGFVLQYDRAAPYLQGYELVPRYQSDMQYAEPVEPPEPEYSAEARLSVPARPFRPDIGEVLPIGYSAPERSETTIEVYDLQGRLVRTLTEGDYEGISALPEYYKEGFYGEGVRGWDGRDELRRLVPAGTYICRLEVEDRDGNKSVKIAPAVVGIKLN